MFVVKMNVPFVNVQYRDLKVLRIPTVLTGKSGFFKKTYSYFFHADFCIFYIKTSSLKLTQIVFRPQDPPVALKGL